MSVERVDLEDMAKILELIKEYTGKLRSVCDDRTSDRYRLLTVASMMATVLMTLVGAVAAFAVRPSDTPAALIFPLMIGAVGTSVAVMFLMTAIMSRRRYRNSFDGKYLFITVERMVRTASQYSEHATRRLSDKFLFDLRLAEAEAVLQMYKQLFEPDINSIQSEIIREELARQMRETRERMLQK